MFLTLPRNSDSFLKYIFKKLKKPSDNILTSLTNSNEHLDYTDLSPSPNFYLDCFSLFGVWKVLKMSSHSRVMHLTKAKNDKETSEKVAVKSHRDTSNNLISRNKRFFILLTACPTCL